MENARGGRSYTPTPGIFNALNVSNSAYDEAIKRLQGAIKILIIVAGSQTDGSIDTGNG